MVIARRGRHTIKVSRMSYEKIFRKKGYVVIRDEAEIKAKQKDVDEKKAAKDVAVEEPEAAQEEQEEVQEEQEEENVDNIPISDMNKQQLSAYAKKHGIDTSGATSVAQARKIIQKEVRMRNMN